MDDIISEINSFYGIRVGLSHTTFVKFFYSFYLKDIQLVFSSYSFIIENSFM